MKTVDEILEYLFSEALLFGEPRPHEKKEIVAHANLELVRWVQGHKTDKCDTPECEPEQLVSHDMAIDAGDPELEGTVFTEATYARCGGCPSCVKDQVLDTLSDEILPEWRKDGNNIKDR